MVVPGRRAQVDLNLRPCVEQSSDCASIHRRRLKMEKEMALLWGRRSDDRFSDFTLICFASFIMQPLLKKTVLRLALGMLTGCVDR